MHWLGLYLPRLPLEVYSRGLPDLPLGITDGSVLHKTLNDSYEQRLLDCNDLAQQRGIEPGQTRAVALAHFPRLILRERDRALEQTSLTRLAGWASQFTRQLAIVEGTGLVLHAAPQVIPPLRIGLAQLGFSNRIAVGITAQDAWAATLAPPPHPSFRPYHPSGSGFAASQVVEEVTDSTNGTIRHKIIHRLLLELCGSLAGSGKGVTALTLHLLHIAPPSTRLTLTLSTPTRDIQRLSQLLEGRLRYLDPIGPVQEIGLAADEVASLTGLSEKTWRYYPPGSSGASFPAGARPLWLLPSPLLLEGRDHQPWLEGNPLRVQQRQLTPPEGDGESQARDHYLAQGPTGEQWWIYREQGGHQRWFLYGVFGE